MKPIPNKFYICSRGTAYRTWWGTWDGFLEIIYWFKRHSSRAQAEMFLFNSATGKSAHLDGLEQRKIGKETKRDKTLFITFMKELAVLLEVPWDQIYLAYIYHLYSSEPKVYPLNFKQDWEKAHANIPVSVS